MKIVVDCYGNDLGAKVAVQGACNAINKDKDLSIVLSGKKEEIEGFLASQTYDKERIEILPADDVILNNESPTEAVKTKTNSSLVKAFDELKHNDDVVGLVSCGSTGAVLTGAFLKIGRIKGISRPALCPIIPAKDGKKVLLVDSGANVDCKPINICHFAIMASSYAKAYLGIENPKVALLNIGTEDKKGNEFCHECFKLLKQMPINFVGNMEARDFLSGNYDIIVTDGFYGNILLKATEGASSFVMGEFKSNIKKSFWSKIGALFMKGSFKNLKARFNANAYGGAMLLGVKKLVVKGHGASDALAFEKAIFQVKTLAEQNLCEKIKEQVENLEVKVDD